MEQPEQIEISEPTVKPRGKKLPMKTEIAVWWILIVGLVGTIAMIIRFGFSYSTWESTLDSSAVIVIVFIAFLCIALGVLYILPAIFLRKQKGWAWIYAVSTLCVAIIPLIGLTTVEVARPHLLAGENSLYYYIAGIIICLVPLILILSDHKKYLTMLSHISAKTNSKTSATTPSKSK